MVFQSKRNCPFCGSNKSDIKRQQSHGEAFWVQCVGCGARGPKVYKRDQAVKRWNEMPKPDLQLVTKCEVIDINR